MKKSILILAMVLIAAVGFGQTKYELNYDSVGIGKPNTTQGVRLNGKVWMKNLTNGTSSDSQLVIKNGRVFKVLAIDASNLVTKTGAPRQTISRETEIQGPNFYITNTPETLIPEDNFFVMQEGSAGQVRRMPTYLFAPASGGNYIATTGGSGTNTSLNTPAITNGTINNTAIGITSRSVGNFTSLNSNTSGTFTSLTGTTSTTSAPGGAALSPLSVTGGPGGFGNNASGSSTGGNANEIRIMGGQGGNASSSTTAIAGKGADVIFNAGDGGLTFGTATTKVAGAGGKAIMQGGSSTGGEPGGVDIKGGNTSAIGGIGGRVRIFGGIGNNEAAGATDDSQYAGIVQLNISNNDAPRGRTLIAVKESDADFTNRLQVGGNVRITGTVTAPTFAGNATSATNWGGLTANFSANPTISDILSANPFPIYNSNNFRFEATSPSIIKEVLATSLQDVTNVGSTTDKTINIISPTNPGIQFIKPGFANYLFYAGSNGSGAGFYDYALNKDVFTLFNGNVGIDNINPVSKLDVSGGVNSTSSQSGYGFVDRSNTSVEWSMFANSGTMNLYNSFISGNALELSQTGIASAKAFSVIPGAGNSAAMDVNGVRALSGSNIIQLDNSDNSIKFGSAVYTRLVPASLGSNATITVPNSTGTMDLGFKQVKTASGNGSSTTISIAHGLSGITTSSFVQAVANNAASAGIQYVTIDATNVNIVYTVAPAIGTNNLLYSISIK